MSALTTTSPASGKNIFVAPAPLAARAAMPVIFPASSRDDLTNIEGIDAATEMALNSIGIRQFSDFRGYTPETLAQLLQTRTGLPIDAAVIAGQDWMAWAEMLATERNFPVAAETNEKKTIESVPENTPPEKLPEAQPEEKPPQTVSAVIPPQPEVNPERPLAAVNGRTNSSVQQPLAPPATETISPAADFVVQISNAKFTSIATPAQPNRPAVQTIQSEIDCNLSGAKANLVTIDRLPLCAQIHAVDQLTGEHHLLASQYELLLPGQLDYRLHLECVAPRVGRYQLQVVAFLFHAEAKIAFYQGPVLRVIA